MEKYSLNNICIHVSTKEKTRIYLEDYLKVSNSIKLIIPINLDVLRISAIDFHFQKICNNSLLNLPDGSGITSLIKLKYKIIIERITGNDIFSMILSSAKKNNLNIAIIGGTKKVLNKVKQKIAKEFKIENDKLLLLSPEFEFEKNDSLNKTIIKRVSEFKPDIVFAALGCPRQEKWLFNNMKTFGSKLNIGIGATLDFYSGEKKRSPIFLQKLGLEWLWRLLNEPKRLFDRYIVKDIPFYFKTSFKILMDKNV